MNEIRARRALLLACVACCVIQAGLAAYRAHVERTSVAIGLSFALFALLPAVRAAKLPRWLSFIVSVVGVAVVAFGAYVGSRVVVNAALGPEPVARALLIIAFGTLLLAFRPTSPVRIGALAVFLVSFVALQLTATRESHHVRQLREEQGIPYHFH